GAERIGRVAPSRSRLGFPSFNFGGEVFDADFFVFGGGVEGDVVFDAGVGGEAGEDFFALVAGGGVDHGEDGVGPIGVGGAEVAVGDGGEGGGECAEGFVLGFGDDPGAHAVGGDAGLAVFEDGGEAAHDFSVEE